MRKLVPAAALSALFAVSAWAASWSGSLIDATCYESQKKTESCSASSKTTAFGLYVSGKLYKFDDAGNSKATAALQNRADRADPGTPQSTMVSATVTGTQSGDSIAVETIDVN
jgi:hypothetical protein